MATANKTTAKKDTRSVDEILGSKEEFEKLIARQPEFLQMKDGRRLAYYQYGAKDGIPTFYCHGGPTSHLDATFFHKAAEKFGYRIIAVDRPGMGLSDFRPHRTALDDANDVAKLADHLGFDKFGVMGMSGGGPTLYACAYLLSKRLKFAVAMACATPVYRDPSCLKKLGWLDVMSAKLGVWLPLCLYQIPFALLGYIAKTPKRFVKMAGPSNCRADKELFQSKTFSCAFMRDVQEAFRQGSKGPAQDAQLVYRPWGFDFKDIQCHVDIRQGSEDRWVPPMFSEYAAKRIPNVTLHMIPGQGHMYHLVYAEEVFKMLEARRSGRVKNATA